jgi:hypothetical protein
MWDSRRLTTTQPPLPVTEIASPFLLFYRRPKEFKQSFKLVILRNDCGTQAKEDVLLLFDSVAGKPAPLLYGWSRGTVSGSDTNEIPKIVIWNNKERRSMLQHSTVTVGKIALVWSTKFGSSVGNGRNMFSRCQASERQWNVSPDNEETLQGSGKDGRTKCALLRSIRAEGNAAV